MKKTLFIDTHLYDINVILFDGYNILREKHVIGQKHNSVFLLSSIKEVVQNDNYDEIVVVNGPGSFTGVRLGVTIAKTLSYCKNIPIKTISALDLMNYSAEKENDIYGIYDGNGFFIGEYVNRKLIKDYYYLTNNEYQQFINNKNVTTNVTIDYKKILNALELYEIQNPHTVNPIYIKLIGVENDKKN